MKFQLKALAAAAILAASVPAQAAIDATASGNGSMILTVLDTISGASAAFDLGKNYLDFNQVATAGAVSNVTNPGTSFSWDLAGNADYSGAWSQFLTASASDANIRYAITAGDNLGSGIGSRGYITTYAGAGAATTTNQVITALGNFDTYTANLAVLAGSTTITAANGAAFQAPNTTFYNGNKNNNTGPLATGLLGSSLGVIQSVAAASTLSAPSNTIFGNGAFFNLSSTGTLVYSVAAVPEADTWAMMMLGLGFMGFVARRKQA
jgi:PEP-CTERM motif